MSTKEIPKIPSEQQDGDRKDSSSTDMEHVDDQSSDEHKRRRENNEIEHLTMDSESEDEVFLPTNPQPHTVGIIPEEKSKEEEEEEVDPDAPRLRNRRVSYGKIPVPPMPMTVEDIQEAAKQSREEQGDEPKEVRKLVDPRRSSVSIQLFKGYRDPHDRRHEKEKNMTVHVEGPDGKFREMRKQDGHFWEKETAIPKKEKDDEEDSVIPYLLKAAGQAYRTQRVYNSVANIVQGFLAGVSVMLTIFSFNLNAEVLLDGYRFMSLPIHACFLVAFSIGFVSAIDRTGVYDIQHFTSKERLKATIYNNGLFTLIVWFVGLIATSLCIQLETQLAFAPTQIPSKDLVNNWRIFNVFRSLSAALGFLLLAFKPDSDTMAKELRQAIYDHLEEITEDQDRKNMILTAMKIREN